MTIEQDVTWAVVLDSYQPDYSKRCEVCGCAPVVTGIKDGKVVYEGSMCGPHTWGEAAMADPEQWNL